MTKKIFRSIFLVAIIVLVVCFLLVMGSLYQHFNDRLTSELKNEAVYIARGVALNGQDYLAGFEGDSNRVTLIAADGTVLYDNMADAATMENHAGRSEVQDALLTGEGRSTRNSATLSKKTVYYALRLEDGTVLRISNTQSTVLALLMSMVQPVLVILALAIILSLVLAFRVAKYIVKPINELDLDQPELKEPYEEIAPLLSRINRQNQTIRRQMAELQRQRQEFRSITENMAEGFLVVDKQTDVLSYNSSALRLLGAAGGVAERQSALTLNRSGSFRTAVEQALAGQHNEQSLTVEGRYYRLMANPVARDGEVSGAVLIILDVTEQEQREALRREFSANVSHELKTPLTSISGFAEIIMNGMVKPEDVPHFAENIYRESQRLIALVADIIQLSQLDEETVPDCAESVDLYALAGEVLARLEEPAARLDVKLELAGGPAEVQGVRRILDEMVYNLCENAVKYNRQGGSVTVTVDHDGQRPRLCVADTGIGIPHADRERVFERFYRVDKSHSREIGGTGLGLSIVKHGAAFHHATLRLESEPDKGTRVTVTF